MACPANPLGSKRHTQTASKYGPEDDGFQTVKRAPANLVLGRDRARHLNREVLNASRPTERQGIATAVGALPDEKAACLATLEDCICVGPACIVYITRI